MKHLRILCDLDAIVADLTKKWLEHYNRDHSDSVTKEDITSWHMANHVKIGEDVHKYLYEPGFFLDLEPLPGAIESLRAMKESGHHVVIVSAPSWPGTSAQDKISWVKKHLPFLNKRDIFLGHHKHMLKGDVFIDDSPTNITAYRKEWGAAARIMTIAHPYNESVKSLVNVFADGYKDTAKAWDTIRRAIDINDGREEHRCVFDKSYFEGNVTGVPDTIYYCACGATSR